MYSEMLTHARDGGEPELSQVDGQGARCADLVRYAADPIIQLDTDGRIALANCAAERSLGAATGGAFAGLWPPDAASLAEMAVRQAAGGTPSGFCSEARPISAEHGAWRVTVAPVRDDGGAVCALAVTCSAVGEREREASYLERQMSNAVFDSVRAGLSVLSRDLDILRVNHAMLDRHPQSLPLEGKKCYEAYHGRTEPCEVCPTLRAIETGMMQMDVVPLSFADDSGGGWLEIYAQPFMDADGRVAGVIENVIDVTERRRTEERLRHVARMSAVGQLAGGIAHEFNNIMASIMGYAQLAMQTGQAGHVQRALAVAEAGCKRGKEITDSLLAFASPRGLKREFAHIDECVNNALGLIHMELANAHIELSRGDASAIPELFVDRRQMEQVFLNLAMNALQALPEGGELTVAYSLTKCDARAASPRCHVELRDTGIGMTQAEIDRIFDPFFTTKGRLGNSETPGMGLGLSVAHGLVMAHGGALHVSSVPGEGTRIAVCLPLPDGGSCAHGPEVSTLQDTMKDLRFSKPLRVLIAEDEDPLRELLCEILRGRGHDVTGAADGQQALRALGTREWDLIITDILMPKANGTELLKQLRADGRNVPCIVISGRGEDILQKQASALGAAVCLRKPFDITDILAAVDEATAHLLKDKE
jgi:signal transduction histidine kinase/ActR/RegA family two-component response regulator